MGYMSVAIHQGKLRYYFGQLQTNAACLILRQADKDAPGAVFTAEYTAANSKHAEQHLLEAYAAANIKFKIAHVYLFSYYSPCKNCKNLLKSFYGKIPNAKWKLAFQHYYLGKYSIQYLDIADAVNGMNELYAKGWKVSRWDLQYDRFTTDESDEFGGWGTKTDKFTGATDPAIANGAKFEMFSHLNRGAVL
jgi:hypothetical protein